MQTTERETSLIPHASPQAVVDLGAIDHNVRLLRQHAGDARVMAVVKADAYGHGAVEVGYIESMRVREHAVSTFMGSQLAIPHGTNETKDAILDSALSFVRYDGGVDWDGQNVSFVVGIAGKGDEHLEILSQIALIFSEDDDVARLKAAATPEELLALLSSVNG